MGRMEEDGVKQQMLHSGSISAGGRTGILGMRGLGRAVAPFTMLSRAFYVTGQVLSYRVISSPKIGESRERKMH